jgi:hypothetical protein
VNVLGDPVAAGMFEDVFGLHQKTLALGVFDHFSRFRGFGVLEFPRHAQCIGLEDVRGEVHFFTDPDRVDWSAQNLGLDFPTADARGWAAGAAGAELQYFRMVGERVELEDRAPGAGCHLRR